MSGGLFVAGTRRIAGVMAWGWSVELILRPPCANDTEAVSSSVAPLPPPTAPRRRPVRKAAEPPSDLSEQGRLV